MKYSYESFLGTRLFSLSCFSCFLLASAVHAAPRRFGYTWPQGQITYYADVEGIPRMSRASAQQAVTDAFRCWTSVDTAAISVQGQFDAGDIRSIDELSLVLQANSSGIILILDNTGEIGREYTRLTGHDVTAIGHTHHESFSDAARTYNRVLVFVNVPRFTRENISLTNLLAHEFGHALGLDHSQINFSFGSSSSTTNRSRATVMHPATVNSQPTVDDKAWISALYPKDIFEKYGFLEGRIVDLMNRALSGVHVRAVKWSGQPLQEQILEQTGMSTGVLMRGEADAQGEGLFRIPVVPGNYVLRVENDLTYLTGRAFIGFFADTRALPPRIVNRRVPDRPAGYPVTRGMTTNVGNIPVQYEPR